jgi:hypothetical protein
MKKSQLIRALKIHIYYNEEKEEGSISKRPLT